ncbi:MAG: hypothetical protein A2487_06305 [Candidatus Raymondbacteria bacterium RifOxyC12_full_50_8]|uniref:Uncharacterized protein n=1 Tax=Candidatus Raymondbacteria bacterium RIFOXYD12_FULL_49_13 TaxID=1817890 RepID=A0A1F7FC48_UNCRA|nr:MAG: hypothetical protein A2248_03205 [Candidatus Raymondbacteria bacterium RIFOXYA2_FULL_49_16]OGJ93293.1 MAG: hypothetical protein A2350_14590 [Candidatus Raymondbacteria bacterium RifOxyB12_full_50_8]OGK04254.1 MAG: hypothetical protein A2519_18000 [Candidatus Raymondbacteria bacterium RIFOXYD12_FULL_49_13]OGK06059.1 MAG: hypothetical protein A2487_06305 [Candidatus Raymondbacteria bacterium RifOxyC12_full_50_8]OGP42463.1 MAG: hypothetical protein A2324_17240 [Candidatus Raymondbacteria b
MNLPFTKKNPTGADFYNRGINLLLDGNLDNAMRQFRECVELDSEIVDAYYHIGNIFRARGQYERAEKVHTDLLHRSSLPAEFVNKVKRALIRDYLAMRNVRKAQALLTEAVKIDASLWLKEELLKLFEATAEWDAAIELKMEINRQKGTGSSENLEYYYLESGNAIAGKNGRAARIKFKEAMKLNPNTPWPYILIADTYFAENRVDDALQFWSQLFDTLPSKAYLVFDKVERYYFETGAYGEVGLIYRQIVERAPQSIEALCALSNYLFKKGDIDEALTYSRNAVEMAPRSFAANDILIRQLLHHTEGCDALKAAVEGLLDNFPAKKAYLCVKCGKQAPKPHWRCSSCGAWEPNAL